LARDQGDLWDSGRVASDQTAQVEYAGKPLGSGVRAYWKVRAWDRAGRPSPWSAPAAWTMGLLAPTDWRARWIEAPITPVPPVAGHNGFHSAWAKSPEVTKWIAVDLGEPREIDAVVLYPARPWDWPDTPGFLFPRRFRIDVAERPDFASLRTVADRTGQDVPNPGTKPLTLSFSPVRARHVRLVVTRLTNVQPEKFAFALSQMEVLGAGRNWALGKTVTASDETPGSWSRACLVDGIRVPRAPEPGRRQPASMLRKSFALRAPVRRAVVRVSALGLYQLRINGQPVGDHALAPDWTDYHTRVQYQTYDVTPLVRSGENTVAAVLGDGWYAGRIGLAGIVPNGRPWAIYGDLPKLIVQLEIESADGTRSEVVTDGTWRVSSDGPVRANDILDGETHDARRDAPGWDRPGFDDSAWPRARVVEKVAAGTGSAAGTVPILVAGGHKNGTVPLSPPRLVAQPNEPIRVVKELRPVAAREPKPGVWVFDLGQNMVGRSRFTAQAPAGTTVTFRFGEAVNPDGTLYTANLRGAKQIDQYTFRGQGTEVFEPLFTYHGFRYVELTGFPGRPPADCLVGRVFHSAAPDAGRFACSDAKLTRLMENIVWTQRANLMSTPTDCPQRDERLGWMGDIQAFSQTACFNMDMAGFFTKWVQDIRDAQARDGRFPDFAPHPFGPNERFSGVPAWADAGVVVPWRAYENYADTRMLAEHFDSARRWIEYIRQRNPDLIWRNGRNNDYNDWLNGDTLVLANWPKTGGAVPNEVFATAFFAQSTQLVARMAGVLGRREDAQSYSRLAEQIRSAFCREFVKPDGRIKGDTQAGYALALHFNLLPEALRPAVLQHMLEGIGRYGGRLSTGIQSTHRLMLELSRAGKIDVAYRLLESHQMPSWLYSLDQGATTIWERWDGYVAGRGFQDPGMNSLNHWAFGSVGEWMWRNVVGLNPDDTGPGYQRFVIRPRPGGGLTWASGQYESIRGRIACAWKTGADGLALTLTVPPNTSATVYVPAKAPSAVTEGGKPAAVSEGVKFLRMEAGAAIFAVESGSYVFLAP
jgi:alpha-L-rhamnosidase